MEEKLKKMDKQAFQEDLLRWFERNQRDLPWRKDKDPYKVWVSEIMLQQTRVDTVIPYFERFMERFPTIEDLADADEEEVLKAWEGLGYYSRARNLQTAAREVKEKYGGQVPDRLEQISELKGVGSYTAGAILSIAYGKPVPAVDGNVMRVMSRILCSEEDIQKVKTRKRFEQVISQLIPEGHASYFNQALMELGALVCAPKNPRCLLCPVQRHCQGREAGIHERLPVKTRKTKVRRVEMVAAVVFDDSEFLINKRPQEGLLAGLWEFPNVERNVDLSREETIRYYLRERYRIETDEPVFFMEAGHVFSHLRWDLYVYTARLKQTIDRPPASSRWVSQARFDEFAFPVSHAKVVQKIKQAF